MVVVAIVGVLASYALQSMRDLVETNRMKTVSLDIYTSLTLARSEAIKRNTGNISMVPVGGSWQSGWTVCVDSNADGSCSGETVVTSGDAVDSSLTITGPTIVTYNRDGRLSTAAATFQITAGANNARSPMRCVSVTTSGRPSTSVDSNHVDSDGCN